MKHAKTVFLLAISVFATVSMVGAQDQSGERTFGAGYSELQPPQQALLDDWIHRYSEVIGKKVDPKEAFESAPISVRTTFDAVTHALATSKLTGEGGDSLGSAIDLISSIETIRGKMKGAGADLQFRLYALLKPGAVGTLKKSREFKRAHDNTIYHRGYPMSFRQQGGAPSIQFSISRDENRADIDVDYRSMGFPAVLLNGHLTAANSDVRAGANFDRHVDRWAGLSQWWQGLLDFDLLRDLGTGLVEDTGTIPAVPRAGKRPLPEAVKDMLEALFVEGAANEAVAYLSDQAYSCYELQGVTGGEPLNRGLAPYVAMNRFEQIHELVENSLGKTTGLGQVVRGVRLSRYPQFRLVKNPYQDRFVLYDVPEGMALEWACSTRLSGETPVNRDSKRYGRYFLAVFRVPPASQGTTVAVLLGKESGQWKVLSFESEADVDYSSVPDLRPTVAAAGAMKTAKAEATLLRAMYDFHRDWFVSRYYTGALSYISPEIFDCRNLYLPDATKPPENFDGQLERWREGMRRTVEQIGIHQDLSDAIRAVTPSRPELAIVPHRWQDAFTIIALSDPLGEAARCESLMTEAPEIEDELFKEPAGGHYYAAIFQIETAGGSPAALTTVWRKINGNWRIYSYRIHTP